MKMNRIGWIAGVVLIAMAWTAGAQEPAAAPVEKPAKKAEARFAALDLDQDGFLSKEEFVKGATRPKSAGKAFAKRDKDGNGKLSLAEFSQSALKSALEKVTGGKRADDDDGSAERDESPLRRDEFGEKGVDY